MLIILHMIYHIDSQSISFIKINLIICFQFNFKFYRLILLFIFLILNLLLIILFLSYFPIINLLVIIIIFIMSIIVQDDILIYIKITCQINFKIKYLKYLNHGFSLKSFLITLLNNEYFLICLHLYLFLSIIIIIHNLQLFLN